MVGYWAGMLLERWGIFLKQRGTSPAAFLTSMLTATQLARERVVELSEKARAGTLTAGEEQERDSYPDMGPAGRHAAAGRRSPLVLPAFPRGLPLPFQIDPGIAEQHGGRPVENLALTCPHCRTGAYIAGLTRSLVKP